MPARQRSRRGLAHWIISTETPIFVVDSRRVVLVFNQGCELLTGWPAADVIGQICSFVNPADDSNIIPVTSALVPPEQAFLEPVSGVERSFPLKDGANLIRAVDFFPLRDKTEQTELRVLGIITDRQIHGPAESHRSESWHSELLQTVDTLRRRYQIGDVIARTPAMHRVLSQLQLAGQSSASVHFQGEQGAGKEYLARCLHRAGTSTSKLPFLPLDCQSLTHFEIHRTLQRAYDPEQSIAQPAGTLYFRNVTSLARDLQVMLLAFKKREPNRWRILSSSRTPFEDAVNAESCSDEFMYELTTVLVQVPPLRHRRPEILLLAQQILERQNLSAGHQLEGFDKDVQSEFENYQWPGNLNELVAVVEEACRNCSGSHIELQDLPFRFRAGLDAQRTGPPTRGHVQNLDDYLLDVERARIAEVMELVHGNKTAAAEILGIPRPKLYRRLEALGLVDSDSGIQIESVGPNDPNPTQEF